MADPTARLLLDDGTEVTMPLTLLRHFRSLATMVEDLGGDTGMAIPLPHITLVQFRWLVKFYTTWDTGLEDMQVHMNEWPWLQLAALSEVLHFYIALDFLDSPPAERVVRLALVGDARELAAAIGVEHLASEGPLDARAAFGRERLSAR